jgi:hypothetical protein
LPCLNINGGASRAYRLGVRGDRLQSRNFDHLIRGSSFNIKESSLTPQARSAQVVARGYTPPFNGKKRQITGGTAV